MLQLELELKRSSHFWTINDGMELESESDADFTIEQLLRKRKKNKKIIVTSEESGSDENENTETSTKKLSKVAHLSGDKTPKILKTALSGLSNRWKNWVMRGIFGWLMIGGFCLLISMGPLAIILLTLAIQAQCYTEIINIGYTIYNAHKLPWFRTLSWYFLLTSNYFFYGESLFDYCGQLVNKSEVLKWLLTYHRFISFSLYMVGFVCFVLTLVKKHYMRQFSLFAWTHVTLLIIVTQSYLIIQNIFEGMIWFFLPVSMIICNDVMAYMFGFFFGKTPLIRLSPKKTWEGFVGGGVATVLFGILGAHVLSQYEFFVCPVEYHDPLDIVTSNGMDGCQRSYLFQYQEFQLPSAIADFCGFFGFKSTITMYPFVLHSLSMSIFSSVIGPFGGFFASGFKRAFKIKDFGDTIPGHGGILDRFDCQFLMATFVNVYLTSFIRTASPQKLLQQVLILKPEQQLQLLNSLQDSLVHRGLLQL